MTKDFRSALIWHLERHGTKMSELVRATGISRDTLNKLIAREGATTAAETALVVASFYGESLKSFIRCDDGPSVQALAVLLDLLRPEEAEMLEAQIRGLLERRGPRS